MCGIAADARRPEHAVDAAALRRMAERMAHRGPDGRRLWTDPDGAAGLAHARLSIVDLSSAGDQPMSTEDGRLWLACNGEIYNHAELRAELRAAGHVFRSASDNEVLLHGWEQWGRGLLDRVRGMFAFALYERAARRMTVVRDRLGEKPLVYLEDAEGVLAASEVPALRASGRLGDEIDPRAIAYMLARNLRHVPDPLCVFAGARRLEPGHMLTIEDGRVVERARWWAPTWRGAPSGVPDLRRALERAVDLQRQADVEVGALLSGGLDSSAVVALAAREGATTRTYALGRDAHDPELARARRASARFGTLHHEATFDPGQLRRLDVLIGRLGEPIGLLPLTHMDALMRRVAEDGLRVVLTGNGADEMLFGYSGVRRLRLASLALGAMDALPPAGRRTLARGLLRAGPLRELGMLAPLRMRARKPALYRAEMAARAKIFRPELRASARAPDPCPVLAPWAQAFDGDSYIELSQYLTLMVEDAHSVTIGADLVGMHHSVEVRSPFLDHDVVQTSALLPTLEKAGSLRRPEGKRALKRALAPLVGADIAYGAKMGFGHHLQESELIRGPFRAAFEERLAAGEGIARLFDRGEVRRRLDEHLRGAADWGKLLMGLYAVEAWHRQAIAGERP